MTDPTEVELLLGRIAMKARGNDVVMSIEPFEATDIEPGFILVHDHTILGYAVEAADHFDRGVFYLDRSNDGHVNHGEMTIDYLQSVYDRRRMTLSDLAKSYIIPELAGCIDLDFIRDDKEYYVSEGLPREDWEHFLNWIKLARAKVLFPGDPGYDDAEKLS